MAETTQQIFFRIAREHALLSEQQITALLEAQDRARSSGAPRSVDALSIDMGYLGIDQVKGIERGVRYYVVRKADKLYGKVARERGLVDAETIANCLKKQKLDFTRRHVLVRLSKLLLDIDALTLAEDQQIREEVIRRDRATSEAARPPAAADASPPAANADSEDLSADAPERVYASEPEEETAEDRSSVEEIEPVLDEDGDGDDEVVGSDGEAVSASDDGEEASASDEEPEDGDDEEEAGDAADGGESEDEEDEHEYEDDDDEAAASDEADLLDSGDLDDASVPSTASADVIDSTELDALDGSDEEDDDGASEAETQKALPARRAAARKVPLPKKRLIVPRVKRKRG